MEIIPLQDYVVIHEAENIVKSSIIITDVDMEPTNQGKILRLPEQSPLTTTALKEGDLVIFKAHMFDHLDELLTDERMKGLVLGKQEHVIAVIKPTL